MKSIIKYLAVLFALFLGSLAWASSVTFEWDHDDGVVGYRLYQSQVSGSYSEDSVAEALAGTKTATIEVAEGRWYWVVTAYNSEGESDYSNEVTKEVGSEIPDITPPDAPTKLRIVLAPTVTIQNLPLALQGSIPESKDVILVLNNISPGTTIVELIITIFDADFSDEGRLFINDQSPISLFGNQAMSSNDGISKTLDPISTDFALYQLGENILTFWHDRTAGYIIEDINIVFR